jgi:hypothetical protein
LVNDVVREWRHKMNATRRAMKRMRCAAELWRARCRTASRNAQQMNEESIRLRYCLAAIRMEARLMWNSTDDEIGERLGRIEEYLAKALEET